MSFDAFVWAWDQRLVKDEHLIILLTLANIANENHEVYAGQPYIAAMARKEERTVRRALVAMLGMEQPPISVRARPGTTDVITLNIPDEFTVRRRRPPEGQKRGRKPKSLVDTVTENAGHGGRNAPPKESDEPIEGTKGRTIAPDGASSARGSRLPEGWEPEPNVATLIGLTADEAADQLARFHDYWTAQPGAKGRKADWTATWRNWCRTAMERRNGRGSPASYGSAGRVDPALARAEAYQQALESGARQAAAAGSRRRRWSFRPD